jgi:isopentenyl phosphate kinase
VFETRKSRLEIVNSELIFIKLGGSVLTDKTKPEAIDQDMLQAIARVIAKVRHDQPHLRFLIGHGAGSFGHYWAAQYATHLGVSDATGWHGVALVSDAMGRLNRLVVDALLRAGIDVIGVQPSASALAEAGRLQRMEHGTLQHMLSAGLTPVVCGDVVIDTVQGAAIASTEMVFGYLAQHLHPRRIVLVGEAGVFTADPRHDATAQHIQVITTANIDTVMQHVGASHGVDVTGGMAAKVQAMWQLVQTVEGLEVQLVGTDPTSLEHALRGEPVVDGTVIKR